MKKEVYIQNRRARYEYEFLENYQAGISLAGSEVKSIREGKVSLTDAFCFFDSGELWIKGMTVTPVDENYVHEPGRLRKLLLHKKELQKLERSLDKGLTIVVKEICEVKGRLKFNIALARGKKEYDKRQAIKKREAEREMKTA
jgi:SsrA-binding protein